MRTLRSEGESMFMSGIYPPWGDPSLIKASDISQVENPASAAWIALELVDIVRSIQECFNCCLRGRRGKRASWRMQTDMGSGVGEPPWSRGGSCAKVMRAFLDLDLLGQ